MKPLAIISNRVGVLLEVNAKHKTLLLLDNIIMLEGMINYTTFYLKNNKKIILPYTIQTYEQGLLPFGFVRVHRGFIINAAHTQGFDATEKCICMDNNLKAAVSRRRGESNLVRNLLANLNSIKS